mmetsp:Transcript_42813/g.102435  ORF Transcript_42813/g.102435 Transcript_42813/m.102435 type:complete len:284 (+) Transcript_42813:803-1654(+)
MWLCLLHARREDQRARLDGARQLHGHGCRAAAEAGLGSAADHVRRRARERRRAVLHLGGLLGGTRIDHCLRGPGHLLEAPHDRWAEHVAAERLRHGLPHGAGLHPACRGPLRRPGAALGQPGAGAGQPGAHACISPGLHWPGLLRVQRHRLQAAGEAGRRVPCRRELGQAHLRDRLQHPCLRHAADPSCSCRVGSGNSWLRLLLLRQGHGRQEERKVGGTTCKSQRACGPNRCGGPQCAGDWPRTSTPAFVLTEMRRAADMRPVRRLHIWPPDQAVVKPRCAA